MGAELGPFVPVVVVVVLDVKTSDLAKPFIWAAISHPIESIAITYGLANPHSRGWTYRMLCSQGRALGTYWGTTIQQTAAITWSETLGEKGVQRRASRRAAAKAAERKIIARYIAKKSAKRLGARALTRKVASRAVPFVGWGIIAYDVVDYLHGDDPSFIGDIVTWLTD